jgi:hypothetical protein
LWGDVEVGFSKHVKDMVPSHGLFSEIKIRSQTFRVPSSCSIITVLFTFNSLLFTHYLVRYASGQKFSSHTEPFAVVDWLKMAYTGVSH